MFALYLPFVTKPNTHTTDAFVGCGSVIISMGSIYIIILQRVFRPLYFCRFTNTCDVFRANTEYWFACVFVCIRVRITPVGEKSHDRATEYIILILCSFQVNRVTSSNVLKHWNFISCTYIYRFFKCLRSILRRDVWDPNSFGNHWTTKNLGRNSLIARSKLHTR